MSTLLSQWLVFSLLLFNAVQSKKVCDFSDGECMKKGGNLTYKKFIAGVPGVIEPADPLTLELIEGQADKLKYKLTKPTLTGMANCEVIRLVCDLNDLTFDYFLQCPHLSMSTEYETEGTLSSIDVTGHGTYTLTADDYVIKYKGKYSRFLSEGEQAPRVSIDSFTFETEPKGKLMVVVPELYTGDKEQTDLAVKFLNENPETIESFMGRTFFDVFFTKVMDLHVVAIKHFNVEEIVPAE